MRSRRLKLGVITDEFFDASLGRLGGFGWAARQVGEIFNGDPALGVDVVYVAGEHLADNTRTEAMVHGSRVILRRPTRLANMAAMQRERFDLMLTIDYNHGYSVYLRSLPRTPVIVWVRDPRTPADAARINAVRLPDAPTEPPQGLMSHDGRSLARIARESTLLRRKLLLATPTPLLVTKLSGAYGFEPWDFHLLPNPLRFDPVVRVKSERPTVVFLARLDPYKRPWIFSALATRFPDVDFQFLGQSHFSGAGAFSLRDLPPNVRLLGHVGEAEKQRLLSAAWVAINTSVHEGLAVSFLEALACETPLLSCVDTGFTVSRYGIFTGRFDGSGMESLDAFTAGLQQLLDHAELRAELGRRGREWVRATHTVDTFLAHFERLAVHAGARR
ncbi:glycosyltransferase family 4 protein [Gemmatimonas sp.]|uniref:glycosyltransferase family 4 protein n=1 Tax=Gemmatimonas sp. TaxID=1962908 RepID=UPI00286DD877|nr:glycosyltransferase family 4 protein [Gemmatimonas sp.]